VADSDLNIIAEASRHLPLLTGGSAIAMPLPALYAADGLLELSKGAVRYKIPKATTVVLSGSCSAMTNAQVANYCKQGAPAFRLDPIDLAKDGTTAVLAWLHQQDLGLAPLIYATADPASVADAQRTLGMAKAGAIIEDALSACAIAARDRGARRVIVAGGETSGAVTKALGVSALNIGPEIAPGVPWTFCTSAGQNIALTLKSGNFGTETFFSHAQSVLENT
jgi:uncharacterized protein YgbK (DUF1537 family)